jgi:hypothetical protein
LRGQLIQVSLVNTLHECQGSCALMLFGRHPKIVRGVLIEVLCLDGFAPAGRVFGEHGVPLIVAARVG